MGGIGIILNKNAGKHRAFRGTIGEKLAFVLGDPRSVRETAHVDEIEEVMQAFCERQIDILGISGGDGSNHYVLSRAVQVWGARPLPRVALLCGGTHNAHAASIGVKGSPDKLLANIVRKYHAGEPFQITHRQLLDVDDGERRHHGFSLATGFMYRFYADLVATQRDSPAKVAALLAGWIGSWLIGGRRIRHIFRLEPGRIRVDEVELPWTDQNGISASGMEKLGLGFTPYPRAAETERTFHVGAMRIKPGVFVRLMTAYKRGKIPVHPDAYSNIASRLELELETPVEYVLDGELYRGKQKLVITTGPRLALITG
ncbi:MAG: hypothetical protein GYA21_04015 [Myxococcales bacterium]|nr:hypothetical protein [Myxococcales bacterium]